MVNWDFLTTPNKLVRKNITYGNTKTTVKSDVKYLNGQTALDWIRMGYLNELIARDLQTPSTKSFIFSRGNDHSDRQSNHLSADPIESN